MRTLLAKLSTPAHCFNHPDRPALAICVDCRRSICQACSTQWEGIHCCVDCLAKRRAGTTESGSALRLTALTLGMLALLAAATVLRSWIGAVMAEMF